MTTKGLSLKFKEFVKEKYPELDGLLLNEYLLPDLAKIAQEYHASYLAESIQLKTDLKEANVYNVELSKKHLELKVKLADIKYLNREEVEKVFDKFVEDISICILRAASKNMLFENYFKQRKSDIYERYFTALLDLAIKVDRDRIIACIDNWLYAFEKTYTDFDLVESSDVNKLANEILKSIGGNDV